MRMSKFTAATAHLEENVGTRDFNSKIPNRIRNWKWCGVLGLFAASVVLHAAPVTTLKVMQFNIKVNATLGLNAIEQAIRNENPDVVTLEEADGYTIQPIASSLGGYYWTQTGGAGQYGIISRYPIIKRIGETVNAYGGVGATIELSP